MCLLDASQIWVICVLNAARFSINQRQDLHLPRLCPDGDDRSNNALVPELSPDAGQAALYTFDASDPAPWVILLLSTTTTVEAPDPFNSGQASASRLNGYVATLTRRISFRVELPR